MSIQDPTITTVAKYKTSDAEAFVGLVLISMTVIIELVNKIIHGAESGLRSRNQRISYEITRTPEDAFRGNNSILFC